MAHDWTPDQWHKFNVATIIVILFISISCFTIQLCRALKVVPVIGTRRMSWTRDTRTVLLIKK